MNAPKIKPLECFLFQLTSHKKIFKDDFYWDPFVLTFCLQERQRIPLGESEFEDYNASPIGSTLQ